MPNHWDHAAMEQWAAANPVPAAWGIEFQALQGQLDGDGETQAPHILVPNDPSLVGKKLYLVAYTLSDDDGGEQIWIESDVQTVTLQ